MKEIDADISNCPILKDKAKDLKPEEVKKLREEYEKYVKPNLPSTRLEEEVKGDQQKLPKAVNRPRHKKLQELKKRAEASGCPFLNSGK